MTASAKRTGTSLEQKLMAAWIEFWLATTPLKGPISSVFGAALRIERLSYQAGIASAKRAALKGAKK